MSLEPKTLQFDTAVPAADANLASAQGVTCVDCKQAIVDEYFDINGDTVCASCRDQVVQLSATPKGPGVLTRSALFGLGAAVAGAILYYAVIAITNFEIGIVAIAIGFMVGWGVRTGARGRGGRRFQVLAVVLTYWAVGLAYTPIAFKQVYADQQAKQTAGAAAPQSTAPQAAETASASQEPPTLVGFAVAIGLLLLFSFALPVLIVAGSLPSGLISGAIIAFGMQQAWRMTGVPQLVISGPYRIASKMAS